MSSRCISNGCVDARAPVRATYKNLYKWPESDAEFVKSVSQGGCPRVVESYSCRQLYLRSYTFSKKETMHERTRRRLVRVKQRVVPQGRKREEEGDGESQKSHKSANTRRKKARKCVTLRVILCAIFHRLLSCTASVDVVDGKNY